MALTYIKNRELRKISFLCFLSNLSNLQKYQISKKSLDRSSKPPDLLEIEKQRIYKNIISLFFIKSVKSLKNIKSPKKVQTDLPNLQTFWKSKNREMKMLHLSNLIICCCLSNKRNYCPYIH